MRAFEFKNRFCGLLTITVILCLALTELTSAQQASTQANNYDATANNELIGVKYVDPLSNVAGRVDRTDYADKYECYRCNRFKGGGAACPETQRQIPGSSVDDNAPYGNIIVRGCAVCLKVKTLMYFRNKDFIADKLWSTGPGNHFESMYVISRTCIEDEKDARLTSGCITDTAAGGTIERCYCQGNLCNSSVTNTPLSVVFILLVCALVKILC